MTLQEAVEAPRIWTQGQALEVEGGIAPRARAGLEALGHDVQEVAKVAGGMNGVSSTTVAASFTARPAGGPTAHPRASAEGPAKPASGDALYSSSDLIAS